MPASLDGERFLMIKNDAAQSVVPRDQLIVVQSWAEELKRLVPAK